MEEKLFVSFNSPQCGWMSVGFISGENEFVTVMSYTPYANAFSELIKGLSSLIEATTPKDEFTIRWSSNPEAYILQFKREGDFVEFVIDRYESHSFIEDEQERVFSYKGKVNDLCKPFLKTFRHLREDIEQDEFEKNWRHKFPHEEFEHFKNLLKKN